MPSVVDPSELSWRERKHLENIASYRFVRERNGFRNFGLNSKISLKTFRRLEGLGLVREHNEYGRKTAVVTGNGRQTLGIIEVRRER